VFKIEPVNQAAATGVAGAASDAGILDDARIPQNLLARNAMPRLGELGVGHRAFSCGSDLPKRRDAIWQEHRRAEPGRQ
jgi:hypothetical protein